MTTITKERVAEIIHAAGLEPCDYEEVFASIKTGEIVAMARIALASLTAEPVAWIWKTASGYDTTSVRPPRNRPGKYAARPLYAAPPAPVSVPDIVQLRAQFERWMSEDEKCIVGSSDPYPAGIESRNWRIWNACRAAMLNQEKSNG